MEELSLGERRVLEKCVLFRGVEPGIQQKTWSKGKPLRVERGTEVCNPGKFYRSLGILLTGRAAVTRGELFVSVLTPGSLFGAATLFSKRTEFPATLTAQATCRMLFFDKQTLGELFAASPVAMANYISYLSGRIGFLSDRLNAVSAGNTEEKVGQYLLANLDKDNQVICTAAALARTLGVGRTSLYRAFERLEGEGVITRTGKVIQVNRVQGLGRE